MKPSQRPVAELMTPRVCTVTTDTALEAVHRELTAHGVSAVIVLDTDGMPVGLVSRTDLLRAAQHGHRPDDETALRFDPKLAAADVMHADPVSIEATASLADAARLMAKRDVHRLLVVEGTSPVGVISVTDVLEIVARSGIETPVSDYASETLAAVAASDKLHYAIDRLQAAGVHALVVLDEGWPVGAFTQRDALDARAASPEAAVRQWMTAAVVCVPEKTSLHLAAWRAIAGNAPVVVVTVDDTPMGVLTATDMLFAVI